MEMQQLYTYFNVKFYVISNQSSAIYLNREDLNHIIVISRRMIMKRNISSVEYAKFVKPYIAVNNKYIEREYVYIFIGASSFVNIIRVAFHKSPIASKKANPILRGRCKKLDPSAELLSRSVTKKTNVFSEARMRQKLIHPETG